MFEAPAVAERAVRHAVLLISPELLVGMCVEGTESCTKVTQGLPAGTRVMAVEFRYPWIQFVLGHDSFAEVQPGALLPLLDVSFKAFYDHVSP